MTDAAERKVRLWALRKNGDPLMLQDVVELVYAFADDQEADHGQTIDLLKQVDEKHSLLCVRVAELEGDWHEASATCKDRVEAIVHAEHESRHAAYVEALASEKKRADDPPGVDFRTARTPEMTVVESEELGDMKRAWRIVKWSLIVIGGGILVALADQIGHFIFGGAT
jgi:hypothetical protein